MRRRPSRITLAGAAGFDRSLKLSIAPSLRRMTKSVRVPRVSMPMRTIQHRTRGPRLTIMAPMFKTVAAVCLAASYIFAASPAKIVLVAGKPSHGHAEHEFIAGTRLLEKCLRQNAGVE